MAQPTERSDVAVDFQVVREGDFVRCAATGEPIPLTDLRYWNVPRQQPYRSAEVAFSEHDKSPA